MIVGMAPLASAKSARWIVNNLKGSIIPDWIVERMDKASDAKAEAICTDSAHNRALSRVSAIAGIWVKWRLDRDGSRGVRK